MALMLNGMGVSRGVSIGDVFILRRNQHEFVEQKIDKKNLSKEVKRYKAAHSTAKKQLQKIRKEIPKESPDDVSTFIETHLLMLDDAMMATSPIELIKENQCNAEWALKLQRDAIVKVFDTMDDPYIATRQDDVKHVFNHIMDALVSGGRPRTVDAAKQWKDRIIIADDLTPADTMMMQHAGVAGFVTEMGGPLSHTAILARSLNLPAVVGLHDARQYLKAGESLVVDGESGLVLAEPDDTLIEYFHKRQRDLRRKAKELRKLNDARSHAKSGEKITLLANMEVKAYMRVIRALRGAPLTIRTVDLGADKEIDTVNTGPLAHNPAMGLRGIRLCLNDPSIFVPQLRAILRASAKGPIKILFPMLTTVPELMQAKQLLENTKESMRAKGFKFDEKIKVGGMIEVPAAAISANHFAEHLDFLSIGTNDLIQYTLAIDRIDDQVNYLYDPINPAVLSLIKMVIDAGKKHKIPITMCGEMAGNPNYTRLLLGLGLREFSMPPNSILEIKSVLRQTHLSNVRRPALGFLHYTEREKQINMLEKINS